jgi:replicative DNA helicase
VSSIRARARRVKQRYGDLAAVIVDYVQLVHGSGKFENRQNEVSEVARGLKVMAADLEAPVVALAQISRGVESRSEKRPMMSDLRESGELEQASNAVLFLYRDEVYDPNSSDRGTAEVIVAKNRQGPTGMARLAWLDHYTRFSNLGKL